MQKCGVLLCKYPDRSCDVTYRIIYVCYYLLQVSDALNRRRNRRGQRLRYSPDIYIDGVLVPRGSGISVDSSALELLGIKRVVEVRRDAVSR